MSEKQAFKTMRIGVKHKKALELVSEVSAMEFGYKQCEMGHNIQMALSEFERIRNAPATSPITRAGFNAIKKQAVSGLTFCQRRNNERK